MASFRWAVELVQNGYVGKVTRVEVGLPAGHSDFGGSGKDKPNGPVPAGVDYEMWIGPSQMMPFNPCRFHKNWRWNYNTGGGQLMDWIGHHCDIAHWGLANPQYGCGPDDAVGPLEVSATAEFPAKDDVWNTATKYRIECKYPNNIDFVIAGGYERNPGRREMDRPRWLGQRGPRLDSRRPTRSGSATSRNSTRRAISRWPSTRAKAITRISSIASSRANARITPVEIAHRSQTPGHLGYIASVTGRKLKWDAAKQVIVGDPEASEMVTKKMRAPWTL